MERIIYFDLETKYSAEEVGGWENIEDMGISVGVIWDSVDQQFSVYLDHQTNELVEHCKRSDQIVGFNHVGFDYRVLAGACHAEVQMRSRQRQSQIRQDQEDSHYSHASYWPH